MKLSFAIGVYNKQMSCQHMQNSKMYFSYLGKALGLMLMDTCSSFSSSLSLPLPKDPHRHHHNWVSLGLCNY